MELLRLDSTSYQPTDLVEGYSSLIWTEKYLEPGHFELKTSRVYETQTLLPEKALVTHLDTAEVMIVETHSIERSNRFPELTISGRSLTSFSENRTLTPPVYGEDWKSLLPYKTSEIVSVLLWTHLANNTGEDPTKNNSIFNTRYQVDNLVVTDSTSISDSSKYWYLTPGELFPQVRDFLDLQTMGWRMIRPSNTSGYVVDVWVLNNELRGTVEKTFTQNIEQLRLDIYNGVDRSRRQTVRPALVFSYAAGHVDEPSYLFSSKELKNLAIANTAIGTFDIWPNSTPPNPLPSGLDLRVLPFDGGSKDEAQSDSDFLDSVAQKARIELAKHNRVVLFDGAVSAAAPYHYNTDYYLGDVVTLEGEYGLEESMRVVEYVRTEDQTGDRGYPTLILAS